MAHEFKISDEGLELIKSYEGFRAVETTLVSGQQVIGFGHKFAPGDETLVTREQAEEMLRKDLASYEALVNEHVFAPLSQSQFDALVSLAFNIGPHAFLASQTLLQLNQGRPLDAAAGFDEWRKSEIDGQSYIIDALVRRRTAEKSLFLQTRAPIAAPRHEIPAGRDEDFAKAHADARATALPVFDAIGHVDAAPYDANIEKSSFAEQPKSDEENQESALVDEKLDAAILNSKPSPADIITDETALDIPNFADALQANSALASPKEAAGSASPIAQNAELVLSQLAEPADAPEPDTNDMVPKPKPQWNTRTVSDMAASPSTTTDRINDANQENDMSPIAQAAAEVSEQLDRLIADGPPSRRRRRSLAGRRRYVADGNMESQSLALQTKDSRTKPSGANEAGAAPQMTAAAKAWDDDDYVPPPVPSEWRSLSSAAVPAPANEGAHEDFRRPGRTAPTTDTPPAEPIARGPDAFIQRTDTAGETQENGLLAYVTAFIIGATLCLVGGYMWLNPPVGGQSQLAAFLAPAAALIGGMVSAGSVYYAIKSLFRR